MPEDIKIDPKYEPLVQSFDKLYALVNRCHKRGGIIDSVPESEAISAALGTIRRHIADVAFLGETPPEAANVPMSGPEELDLAKVE